METKQGFRVDVIFGALPFEQAAIRRARVMSVAGQEVRICTPESSPRFCLIAPGIGKTWPGSSNGRARNWIAAIWTR